MISDEKYVKKLLDEGIKCVKAKKVDDAIVLFRQIFVNHPDSSLADNAHYNLGMVYEMKQDFTKAFLEYKTIIEVYPQSDAAMFAKDKIEELNQNLDPAAAEFSVAQNLYINKKHDEAEKMFIDIMAKFPRSTLIDNALFYLAILKRNRNDYEGAKALFGQIVEKYPDSDAAALVPDILKSFLFL